MKPSGVKKGSVMPPVGKILKVTQNKMMSIDPSQKFGIEIPKSEKVVKRLSKIVSFLIAAMMPSGIPMIHASNILDTARFKVLGSLTKSSSKIGCLVIKEVPKSP